MGASGADKQLVLFVATPLEPEHVARIEAVAPDRVEVIYDRDLLPPTRYTADHNGVDGFARTAEQQERWRRHLGRAQVLWDFPPTDADGGGGLAYAPKLEWIQTTSSGVGQTVKRLGLIDSDIIVTTARGVHTGPLTEFTFLTLLSHVKRQRHMRAEQAAHRWQRFCGDELEGKTLAIIGTGRVGRRIAAIGHSFGMRVVGLASPGSTRTAEELGIDELFPNDDLHGMLAGADALVLTVPHTQDTEGLIDRSAIDALKPGAVLVNVARGQVVDEGALVDALRTGRVAFAGLDVFAHEPLPAESPLWDMPNVIVSPHSASTVASENRKITGIFCHNLRCYVDGRVEDMHNVLDKERLY